MISEELLNILRVISPEEQALLDGSTAIQRGIYMDADSDVIDAKKLLDSGRLITIRPHTRFAHFPEHSHNYVEVVYMCCGSTTQIANGKQIVLHEGELLFFGQGARQEILPAGENDIAVNFIILPQFFDKVLEMLDEDKTPLHNFIVDSLGNSAGNTNCLYFQVADALPIQNLIENLIWTLTKGAAPNRRSSRQCCASRRPRRDRHVFRGTGNHPAPAHRRPASSLPEYSRYCTLQQRSRPPVRRNPGSAGATMRDDYS